MKKLVFLLASVLLTLVLLMFGVVGVAVADRLFRLGVDTDTPHPAHTKELVQS